MSGESKVRLGAVIDAVTLAAERTSSFIDCADASNLLLKVAATRSAYTALHFDVDWYSTDQGSPTAFIDQGVSSVASSGGYCVATLEPSRYTKTTSASANFGFSVACKDRFCKIRLNSTAGGAGDTVTVTGCLVKP